MAGSFEMPLNPEADEYLYSSYGDTLVAFQHCPVVDAVEIGGGVLLTRPNREEGGPRMQLLSSGPNLRRN